MASTPRDQLEGVYQVAMGMAHLHERRILHCDLAARNISKRKGNQRHRSCFLKRVEWFSSGKCIAATQKERFEVFPRLFAWLPHNYRGVASRVWRCFAGGVWVVFLMQETNNFTSFERFWTVLFLMQETNNFASCTRLSASCWLTCSCWLAWHKTRTCLLITQRERETDSETAR